MRYGSTGRREHSPTFAGIALSLLPLLLSSAPSAGESLFDGSFGTLPAGQGWTFFSDDLPSTGLGFNDGSAYRLDTNSDLNIHAFNGRGDRTLDVVSGFELVVDLHIVSETHTTTDRAGFSIILIGSDPTASLEIAFWEDRVWVYESGFSHGSGYLIDATQRRVYRLRAIGTEFELFVDDVPAVAGPLQNYTAQGPPYTVANSIIFGDDTTRGRAESAVYSIELDSLALFEDGFETGDVSAWSAAQP